MENYKKKANDIINELDPTKAKCPACLEYKDKILNSKLDAGIDAEYNLCNVCVTEFIMYCHKRICDCTWDESQECQSKWAKEKQKEKQKSCSIVV